MQTSFTAEQLENPRISEANTILRKCVHCGFCTATCPTYVLLGDELDSPRGRIYLIKNMLESGEPATQETVKHLDRCLSCLSCMTTCPSGVNYMHLIDEARAVRADAAQCPGLCHAQALVFSIVPHRRKARLTACTRGEGDGRHPHRGTAEPRAKPHADAGALRPARQLSP